MIILSHNLSHALCRQINGTKKHFYFLQHFQQKFRKKWSLAVSFIIWLRPDKDFKKESGWEMDQKRNLDFGNISGRQRITTSLASAKGTTADTSAERGSIFLSAPVALLGICALSWIYFSKLSWAFNSWGWQKKAHGPKHFLPEGG